MHQHVERHGWSHPETHYVLPRKGTGDEWAAPTGEVVCEGCGCKAMAVDDITHRPGCPNTENPWREAVR